MQNLVNFEMKQPKFWPIEWNLETSPSRPRHSLTPSPPPLGHLVPHHPKTSHSTASRSPTHWPPNHYYWTIPTTLDTTSLYPRPSLQPNLDPYPNENLDHPYHSLDSQPPPPPGSPPHQTLDPTQLTHPHYPPDPSKGFVYSFGHCSMVRIT